MYTKEPKRNNHTVVRKRPDCRKACSASPNGMSHATKKALSCCKRYHSAQRKRLFRKTEDKAPRAVGSLTAYQSADYGKTAKNVIFRENSVRGIRVSEYGSFRDNVLTFSIYNMLIYIYPNYSAILCPPFFPTLSPVPQTKPRAAVSRCRSRDITTTMRSKVWLHACAETPK